MALENFTTYAETDPNAKITVGANTLTLASIQHQEPAYVRKDYGAAHFGDFTHYIDNTVSSVSDEWYGALWALANAQTNEEAMSTNDDGAGLELYKPTGVNRQWYLNDFAGNLNDSYTDSSNTANRWFTISRSGSTYTILIYSDSNRTTLLDTLSVNGTSTTYRYVYGYASGGAAGSSALTLSGTINNLDLNESVAVSRGIMSPRSGFWGDL